MAKTTIVGDAIVITSALTLEGIRTIEKYRPKSLLLMGGEGGKEQIFRIGTTFGAGNINACGASFNSESHDGNKYATITLTVECPQGDVKNFVAESIGGALINLNKLEATLPEVLNEIAAEKETIMENITIA